MPLPRTALQDTPPISLLRRGLAPLAALVAALLWLSFLPALLRHDSLVPLGGGCWVHGYRDPVTGRGAALGIRESRRAEACLALSRREGRQ